MLAMQREKMHYSDPMLAMQAIATRSAGNALRREVKSAPHHLSELL